MELIYTYFFAISRWITAFLSLAIVFAWVRYFLKTKKASHSVAALVTVDGISLPITAMEVIIGRTKPADIIIPLQNVHKKHALLSFKKGHWQLSPLDGKVAINLQNLSLPAPLEYGDKITIAGQTLVFKYKEDENISSSSMPTGCLALLFLTLFQIFVGLEVYLKKPTSYLPLMAFGMIILGEWLYFLIGRNFADFKMLMEIPVLYLSTLGLTITASYLPNQLLKQAVCYLLGFAFYLVFTFVLKYRDHFIALQRVIMLLSLALLYYTAFFGTKINSARNWLSLGGISFQPSELVKVAFVAASGISLYVILKQPVRRLEFLAYAILSMGALAIMLDFGAVAIFFMCMLAVLALRLEHPAVLGGIAITAVLGAGGIIMLYPYIARRFSVWLKAWSYADSTGYQQTRTMMYFGSGGLLGVGPGNGHLTDIPAAETDLVFGIIGEDMGWIIAFTTALAIIGLGIYAFRLIQHSTCLFDAVTVGGAIVMIIFQSALNIFGSVDLLPLTGVTLIFISAGGSSLISAWLMMSFFKAAELHPQSSKQWRETQ